MAAEPRTPTPVAAAILVAAILIRTLMAASVMTERISANAWFSSYIDTAIFSNCSEIP